LIGVPVGVGPEDVAAPEEAECELDPQAATTVIKLMTSADNPKYCGFRLRMALPSGRMWTR